MRVHSLPLFPSARRVAQAVSFDGWPRPATRPGPGAYAVMALDGGRRHDDYVEAERCGLAGLGHRSTQKG
jgi:hypothetical protein